MPVKIMVLIPTKELSGPLKGVLQMVEYANSDEFEFRLYGFRSQSASDSSLANRLTERGIRLHTLTQNRRSYISLSRQVIRELRDGGFDALQTHGFKPTFLAFVARLFCKVKWICFMHGTTGENLKVRLYNMLDSVLQRAADRTVLVSESQRKKIVGGTDKRWVRVLHNAVDVDNPVLTRNDVLPVRQRLGLSGKSKLVVTVGRMSPEKGLDVLVEAFALLVKRVADVHLVLVGDGQERQSLEALVRKAKLEKVVHFVGYTKTPGDYLIEASVFALPSRSEGIPNAVLEAMALGVPVVATGVGGVPEIIQDGVTGRLVTSEEPGLLGECLAELLLDSKLRRRFAVRGRRRVREAFSVSSRLAKLEAIYHELLPS